MSLYLFAITENDRLVRDTGNTFDSDGEAWKGAVGVFGEFVQGIDTPPTRQTTYRLQVRCGVGNPLFAFELEVEPFKEPSVAAGKLRGDI